jgi:hypothetical protein
MTSLPHARFRGRLRPFFSCVSPVTRVPACLPALDGNGLPRPVPPFCLRCARSRASNLAIKALAFPISHFGTNVALHEYV